MKTPFSTQTEKLQVEMTETGFVLNIKNNLDFVQQKILKAKKTE